MAPPKRKSGPRTTAGKRAVAANTTTHGLTAKGLLRCRRHACYYFVICPIQDELEDLPRGACCPVETELFREALGQYQKELDQLDEGKRNRLARELAILEVQSYRCDNAIALHSEITREVKLTRPGNEVITRTEMMTALRYKTELLDKIIRINKTIQEGNDDDDAQ